MLSHAAPGYPMPTQRCLSHGLLPGSSATLDPQCRPSTARPPHREAVETLPLVWVAAARGGHLRHNHRDEDGPRARHIGRARGRRRRRPSDPGPSSDFPGPWNPLPLRLGRRPSPAGANRRRIPARQVCSRAYGWPCQPPPAEISRPGAHPRGPARFRGPVCCRWPANPPPVPRPWNERHRQRKAELCRQPAASVIRTR
jgi:hypothetical protein